MRVRLAVLAVLVLATGAASAATTKGSPPKLGRIHAVAQQSSRVPSWVLTAAATDRNRDLAGGRVTIRLGREAYSRKIVAAKRFPPKVRTLAETGISSALLVGTRLRVGLSIDARPGPLQVRVSVADAHRHSTRPVVLRLRIASPQAVTIAATGANASEPATHGTFTVTRSGSTASAVQVAYSVGGTATPGADYAKLPGTVTIPKGEESAEIDVAPIDDPAVEPPETVVVTLTAKAAYKLGSPKQATLRIADNDGVAAPAATVSVSATDPSAAEPSDPGTFTITRTGSTSSSLVVFYTVGGTATAGLDYLRLPGSVTIPAGSTSATVTVTPLSDTVNDPGETVVLTLVQSTGYGVGTPSSATVSIANQAVSTVTIAAADPTAAEPLDTGTFTVTRTGDTTSSLTASYSVFGTATAGTDYTALPGTVTIPSGATSATITVTPVDDTVAEDPETVTVSLLSGIGYAVGFPSSATVTINDNDSGATVTIAATDANAAEPSDPGTFTVTRTGATTAALVVSYTVSGTATAGTDYTTLPGTVTIAAGSNTAIFDVSPIDDTVAESAETVIVTLGAGTGYTVGTPDTATVTIADNDGGGGNATVTIAATDDHAGEPNDPGVFTVTRTGDTAAPLNVFYSVTGTATNGADYTALPGSVTIPAGETSATIVLGIIDDTLVEGPETAILTLVGTASYAVGTPGDASITITDND